MVEALKGGLRREQQEKLKNLVKSLPSDVRKQKIEDIKLVQANLSKSLQILQDKSDNTLSKSADALRTASAREDRPEPVFKPPYALRTAEERRHTPVGVPRTLRGWSVGGNIFTHPPKSATSRTSETGSKISSRNSNSSSLAQITKSRNDARRSFDFKPPGRDPSSPSKTPGEDSVTVDMTSQQMRRDSNQRGSASESSLVSSIYSGASTPVAGRTWGHLTRTFGNGIGRKHFDMHDHLHNNIAEDDEAGPRKYSSDAAGARGGGKLWVVRGRKHGKPDHDRETWRQTSETSVLDDTVWVSPDARRDAGMSSRDIYLRTVQQDPRVQYTHQDRRYSKAWPERKKLAPSKRHIRPDHDRETWRETRGQDRYDANDETVYVDVADRRFAGMSSRDIQMRQMQKDPRVRHTDQDRKYSKDWPDRKDAMVSMDQKKEIVWRSLKLGGLV